MTLNDGFERTVSDWLDEQAGHGMPGYLDEALARTTRTRQRPWWSSPERWLPVDIAAYRSAFNRPASVRGLAVLIVLVLLIAAIVAVGIGSQRPLPAPFGLAKNGAVVTSSDGDIFAVDQKTGRTSPLIADAAFDFGPTFSRDGTKFMFLRGESPDLKTGLAIVVADADGRGARQITPLAPGLDWSDWSPDGARIAFLSRPKGEGTATVLNVVNVDGTGLHPLDTGQPAFYPTWLPPDGKEIVFRGEHLKATDPAPGIFAIHPDGTGLRRVSTRPAAGDDDYQSVNVSPDGGRVAYTGSGLEDRPYHVHVLDLASGIDRILPPAAGDAGELGPVFSPDGSSIAYLRYTKSGQFQIVVAPADGSGSRTILGPLGPQASYGPSISNYTFTPDGKAIVAGYDAEKLARVLPLDGSPSSELSHGEFSFITYQRLAP